MTYDPDFKDIFEEIILNDVGTKIIKSVKVGTLPLEIDAVLELSKESSFRYLQPLDNVRKNSGASRLVIEYKGPTDPLSKNNLRKLIAYKELYLIEKDPDEKLNTALLVISTKLPRKLFDKMQAHELAKGIHRLELSGQQIFIISINALEVVVNNYGLLIFSSSKKQLEKLIAEILDHNYFRDKGRENSYEERFLTYAVRFNFETVHRVAKKKGINMSIVLENIMKAIDYFGIEEVVKRIGIEEVIKGIGIEEVIKGIGIEEVIKGIGIEEVIKGIGIENLLKAFRGKIHDERNKQLLEDLIKGLSKEKY